MSDSDLAFRLTECERKIANLLRPAVVAEARYQGSPRVRVKAGDLLSGWLPWLTTRAGADRCWWAPEVGEQVLVLAPDGDLGAAWVLPAGFCDRHPAPADSADITRMVWQDGLIFEHNRTSHVTTLDAQANDGTLILKGKNVVIQTGEEGFFLLDHHGKATRITHKGGNSFETETWEAGANVNAKPDHGYSPPEVAP